MIYGMIGVVERLIPHEAKPSAVPTSDSPSAINYVLIFFCTLRVYCDIMITSNNCISLLWLQCVSNAAAISLAVANA